MISKTFTNYALQLLVNEARNPWKLQKQCLEASQLSIFQDLIFPKEENLESSVCECKYVYPSAQTTALSTYLIEGTSLTYSGSTSYDLTHSLSWFAGALSMCLMNAE